MKKIFTSPSRLLTLTVIFMSFGTISELFLIGHYEDIWQLVPIVLIAATFILFLINAWLTAPGFQVIFKVLAVACIISGIAGIWFHFNANVEFAQEMRPSASSWAIFAASLSGAIPALAPGAMIVFGLIGYIHSLSSLK